MLYLDKGKSYFDHKIVSNYRITKNGAWSKLSPAEQESAFVEMCFKANHLFKGKYAKIFIKWLPSSLYSSKLIKIARKLFGAKIAMNLLQNYQKIKEKFRTK